MNGKVKGNQVEINTIKMDPMLSPLDLHGYTVSATGSGKQLVNIDYLDLLPISGTSSHNSLQETTDIGYTSNNDIIITDFEKGLIMPSPDLCRWRITINNQGQLLTEKLDCPDLLTTMVFNTTNSGVSSNDQIQLPLLTGVTDMYVDWGDGGAVEHITNYTNNTHTYSSSGTKTVTIYGTYSWAFNDGDDKEKLIEIEAWGDFHLLSGAFEGCSNLTKVSSVDEPTLDPILSNAFKGCSSLNAISNLDMWDISNVTHLDHFLDGCISFNQELSLNTSSSLISVSYMLNGCSSFNNGSPSGSLPLTFDTSNVSDFSYMLNGCSSFNQNINAIDFSNAIDVSYLFKDCTLFNNGDTSNSQSFSMSMDVPLALNAESIFENCSNFNQDISLLFDISIINNLENSFKNCLVFNQDLNTWSTNLVTTMSGTFMGASSFNNGENISSSRNPLAWSFRNCLDTSDMFNGTPFNQDSNSWDMSNVSDLSGMFANSGFNNGYPSGVFGSLMWDLYGATSLRSMFQMNTSFNQLFLFGRDVSDVSNVTDFRYMFNGATSFSAPIYQWDVSSALQMDDFGLNSGITVTDYTDMLDTWSTLSLQQGVIFGMGTIQYYGSAQSSRDFMTGTPSTSRGPYGWIITDGGPILSPTITTMVFNTTNSGVSSNDQIQLPLLTGVTDMYVDWGDGGAVEHITNYTNNTHTYSSSGTKTVTMYGTYSWAFNNGGDRSKLTEISEWGDFHLINGAFNGCDNLTKVSSVDSPTVDPILTNAFNNCSIMTEIDNINSWDMSNVTHLDSFLSGCVNYDQELSLNTSSSLTTTARMLFNCRSFNNGGLSGTSPLSFNISNVSDVSYMFYNCIEYNQNINSMDFSSAILINNIFMYCLKFNNGDNGNNSSIPMTFTAPLATNASYTFAGCNAFNQSLNNWNVSSVITFEGAFYQCYLYDQPVDQWVTTNMEICSFMFRDAYAFNQSLNNWDTSKLRETIAMFAQAMSFNNGGASGSSTNPLTWDVSMCDRMNNMFEYTTAFNQPLRNETNTGKWNMASVEGLYFMFRSSSFNQYVGDWVLPNMSNMNWIFLDNVHFNNGESPGSSTSPIEWELPSSNISLRGVFEGASAFNQPILNTSGSILNAFSIIDLRNTFKGASLFNQSVKDWNVSDVLYADDFGLNSGISVGNYTDILDTWSQLTLKQNVIFGMGTIQYYSSAQGSRDIMSGTPSTPSGPYGWIITDGGPIGSDIELSWPDSDIMGWTDGDSVGI